MQQSSDLWGRAHLLVQNRPGSETLNKLGLVARLCAGDASFKCLPHQLLMVRAMRTMVVTGDRESGFDSGEGA